MTQTQIIIPQELEKIRDRARLAIARILPANAETKGDRDFLFNCQRTDAGRSLPPYYLVYFLLVDLLGFPNLGQSEKTAWSVPIDFEGNAFLIEHRKFGIGVFARDAKAENENAKRIVALIKRGVKVAQPFFRWIADNAVRDSKFNVINKGSALFERYKYLHSLYKGSLVEEERLKQEQEARIGQREFSTHLFSVGESKNISPSDIVNMFKCGFVHQSEEVSWLAIAAIDAFFAWTEHIFVHLAILQERITTGSDVGSLIGAEWGEKYKCVFDVQQRDAKAHFDELTIIRRQLRNFVAHGAFGKEGEAFHFHSRAGAVPVALDYRSSKPKFSLSPELGFDDAYAFSAIDHFITFLWSGSREPARIYIQDYNLPLILPMAQDGTYKKAMASVSEMTSFVEHLSAQFDNAANMDW
jgi:hypothetical protein